MGWSTVEYFAQLWLGSLYLEYNRNMKFHRSSGVSWKQTLAKVLSTLWTDVTFLRFVWSDGWWDVIYSCNPSHMHRFTQEEWSFFFSHFCKPRANVLCSWAGVFLMFLYLLYSVRKRNSSSTTPLIQWVQRLFCRCSHVFLCLTFSMTMLCSLPPSGSSLILGRTPTKKHRPNK